jgi:hypothetical protein
MNRSSTKVSSPQLTDRTFKAWLAYLRPKPDEVAWQAVPWRTRLWDAVAEAQRLDKPILFWTMNGHPLGCT